MIPILGVKWHISFSGWSYLKIAVSLYCVQVLWGSPRCLSPCPFLGLTVKCSWVKMSFCKQGQKDHIVCRGWMSFMHVSVTRHCKCLDVRHRKILSCKGKWGQTLVDGLYLLWWSQSVKSGCKLWKSSNYWLALSSFIFHSNKNANSSADPVPKVSL